MRRLAALNLGQRIVAVVALAAALRTIWVYIVCRPALSDGGWSAYAPLTGESEGITINEAIVDGSVSGFVALVLALGFIAAWACASIWLFGLPRPQSPGHPSDPPSG